MKLKELEGMQKNLLQNIMIQKKFLDSTCKNGELFKKENF